MWCHVVLSFASKNFVDLLSEPYQTTTVTNSELVCVCGFPHRLMLQFDISDVTKEGVGVSCQLMVGQSSVPHYQQLEEFTARLAPGEVSVFVHTSPTTCIVCRFLQIIITQLSLCWGVLGEPDSSPALLGSLQCPCT